MNDISEMKFIIENKDEILELLGQTKGRLQQIYKIMNWYASGECLKNFSGTDPNAVLGEVYLIMAPVPEMIKDLEDKYIESTRPKNKSKVIYS